MDVPDAGISMNYDDPQFVKVLDTCLRMEIAAAQKKSVANAAEIGKLKTTIRSELNNRKELKARTVQMYRVKTILSGTLLKLCKGINETSYNLEVVKANIDDEYKVIQLRTQEYQDIATEYEKTWHTYRAAYEEFPLAKIRREAKINMEKLKIEYMVLTYKKEETMKIIKQRRHIDWIRTRRKIVEFAIMMVEHSRLKKKLMKLEMDVGHHRRELRSIEVELQILRKQEEDRGRLRKDRILKIAPCKINIPYRKMYSQNQMYARMQSKQFHENFDADSISINTLALEELCVNENASPANIDVESVQDKRDAKQTVAVETETANFKDTTIPEKADARIVTITLDDEANAETPAALSDNDVEMKEAHCEETQESPGSIKAQHKRTFVCPDTKEHSFKHSAAKDTQEEIEAKKIRLAREDSAGNGNEINTSQSAVIEEVDLTTPSPPGLKITNIETVHYDIASIKRMPRKNVQRSNVTATSIFSPVHYEYCESTMSSFDQDLISKGPPSLFEGSLCNYRLSPNTRNISPTVEDAQMSPPKRALQQDDKNRSGGNISPFQFDNFLKKGGKTGNSFKTLF